MEKEASYKKFAKYYDIIHGKKDYACEAKKIVEIAEKYKKSSGKNLLDVGCGTGRHIEHLRKFYACTGVDPYGAMLKIAKKINPDVKFYRGDMASFKIKQKYDIIICLYNTIAYTQTLSRLHTTIKNLSNHLVTGGVLLIEPYHTKETMSADPYRLSVSDSGNKKIVRVGLTRTVGNIAKREAVTVVIEDNKKIFSFEESRDVGLFETKEIIESMKKHGLEATLLKDTLEPNLRLFMGIKN
jgi:trans-aconitate methyltransferase